MTRHLRRLLVIVPVIALAVTPLVVGSFTVTLLNYVGIYALVALGLVLLTGIGGLTSFGQAAFVGIGAYATAWLTTAHGASPWLGLLLALVIAGLVAAALGAITLRLGGHFLPLSTIAWGISIFFLFGNSDALGRYGGLGGVPPITLGPYVLSTSTPVFYLIWPTLGCAMLLAANLLDSREGRAVRSLRGGALMIESLGVSAFRIRLIIFVTAALLAALAGWFLAHMSGFVSPAPFDVKAGIDYLFMVLVGGAGHIAGAVVGAALVTMLKNWLQDLLPLISQDTGRFETIIFAVLFIIILQHARTGIVPFLTRRLPRSKPAPAGDVPPLPQRSYPARGTPVMAAEGMVKRFGGLVAVNEVSFAISAGEILGLIGPNGAGKSTMFNLITGALAPDAGRISFCGRDITTAGQRRIARAGIARTFQHVKLRRDMSVLDNVLLGAYPRTRSGFLAGALRLDRREESQARLAALTQLDRVGLGDAAHELAGNLPLGRQRLLEIARALAADPAMIVLDEPAAGLRRMEKEALAALLRSLRAEGLTVLLVEHDMDFVMGLVDRIVVMVFGAKLTEGAPAVVRADPRVQDAYLGGVA
jgi:ABC-type branched-subunit amino acid transport system ATPase component/ABC-type branched-subunit amino acid transport system permease subunit